MKTNTTQLPNLGDVILSGLPKADTSAKQTKPKADKQVKTSKKKK
jgi:hypothetical protein